MPSISEVNINKLEFIAFTDPCGSGGIRRRLVNELYRSNKLSNLLEMTKLIRHGKKLYAFENFFLIKAVSLELNDYRFKAIIIDEKRKDNLIQRIINQAVADAAGSHELVLLPSFDKNVQEIFTRQNIEQVASRKDWRKIFSCHRSTFNNRDEQFKLPTQAQNEVSDNESKFDRAVLNTIPERKK